MWLLLVSIWSQYDFNTTRLTKTDSLFDVVVEFWLASGDYRRSPCFHSQQHSATVDSDATEKQEAKMATLLACPTGMLVDWVKLSANVKTSGHSDDFVVFIQDFAFRIPIQRLSV